jgi:hypothetical protein
MTQNLSPDELSFINSKTYNGGQTGPWAYSAAPGPGNMDFTADDGRTYHATYNNQGGSGAEGEWGTYGINKLRRDVNPGQSNVGDSYYEYDPQGNYLGQGQYQPESWMSDYLPFLMAAIPAGLTIAGLPAAGAAGAAGAGTAGATTAGAGSSLYSLGTATGGASSGLGLSAGSSGLGMTAGLGEGLAMTAPAAGSLGGGLGLTAGTGALGTLGTTGLAAGAGSLLGPNALSGTSTLANGTILPAATTAATSSMLPSTGSMVKGLTSLLGGAGSGGSGGLGGGLGQILSGLVDADRQGKSSDKILEWLKSRTDITDNLYKPGTPEYNQLWNEMSRKDAAGGRNSQYGPRSVDLAAKIAQIKAAENTKMTTGIGQWMKGAYDQDASKYSGLLAGLGNASGGSGGGLLDLISSYFKDNGSSLNLEDTVDENLFQPEDGDYGQYF